VRPLLGKRGDGVNYGIGTFPQHADALAASGVTPEHAHARGYRSVDTKKRLEDIGVTPAGRRVPGLLVPQRGADGSVWGYQYRPDSPRERDGKPIKYETPVGQRNGIDVPPGVADRIGDPRVPLWVTEGVKKADAGAIAGLCIVALPGVWSWRGKNEHGGKVAVADWHDIALNDRRIILAFDSDVVRKQSVRHALTELAKYLKSKGAHVDYLHLPDDDDDAKTGLDDYLVAGHTVDDLWRLVHPEPPEVVARATWETGASGATWETGASGAGGASGAPTVVTLDEAHATFRKWLGADYDMDALDATLAAAAVDHLDGDPLWLLLISGSGNAKTETVQALDGIGATVISTISSEGALLSGTAKREIAKDATGGLLREIGVSGTLVVKDVTSILSMDRTARGQVLGALREVYDGRWSRRVGVDGGRRLEWAGRVSLIGAVTTAWDAAHAVVASMGDRFVLLRMDSTVGRQTAGRRAIGNTGREIEMRTELAAAVGGVIAGMTTSVPDVDELETDVLLAAADIVTLARTAVEYDYRGNVVNAHAPEMPTRFAKQLSQVVRGGVAIGMTRADALHLAIRCARDSMPPLRLAIVDDLAANPGSMLADVRRRIDKPRNTVDRQLQALHMLGVLDVDEVDEGTRDGKPVTRWVYRLGEDIDPAALNADKVSRNVGNYIPSSIEEEGRGSEEVVDQGAPRVPTNISGHPEPEVDPTRCGTCGNRLHNGECVRCLTARSS
jgi:hypothetical protein